MIIGCVPGWLPVLCAIIWVGPTIAQETHHVEQGKRLDDVNLMQPTRLGLRLTPDIARGAARAWVCQELDSQLDLDESQRVRLFDLIARRVMELGHENAEPMQDFAEHFLELTFRRGPMRGRWSSMDGPDFADRIEPLIPEFQKLYDGLVADCVAILDERQMARFQDRMDGAKNNLDIFKARMERWRKGEIEDGEHLFRGTRNDRGNIETDDPEVIRQQNRERNVRRAERVADLALSNYGPRMWEQFFNGAREFYQFDDDQIAQGQRILGDCRDRYRDIMTDELRSRIRRNRVAWGFRLNFRDEPCGPWVNKLEREFTEMIQPLSDLDAECVDAIMALATPEQRRAAWKTIQNTTTAHGLSVDELDAEALGKSGR